MNSTPEEQLKEKGRYVTTTSGVSMRPMLRNRQDVVVLRAVNPGEKLKKWDLPIYRRGEQYVLHRIIGVGEDCYLIRGDNTYSVEQVPFENVIGVMTQFQRGGKQYYATDRSYRFYAMMWQKIYPIRFVFVKIRLFGGKILRKFGWKGRKTT